MADFTPVKIVAGRIRLFGPTDKIPAANLPSSTGGYDGDPTVIVQDATHRFATDAEKTTWNAKAPALGADDNYVTDAEKVKVAAIDQIFTSAEKTKVSNITVTQAVDLDDIESRVNNLDAAVVLKGVWDASAGTFPGGGTAQAGASYIVSVGGTVDSDVFAVGDRAIAITDNASTTTFASNWFKADYTDQVLSVNGATGAVTLTTANVADSSDKRYVTDAQQTVIGNTSGTNTGDQDLSGKANLASPTFTGTVSGISAAMVGALATSAFSGLAKISVGTVQPSTPATGDLWIDTN